MHGQLLTCPLKLYILNLIRQKRQLCCGVLSSRRAQAGDEMHGDQSDQPSCTSPCEHSHGWSESALEYINTTKNTGKKASYQFTPTTQLIMVRYQKDYQSTLSAVLGEKKLSAHCNMLKQFKQNTWGHIFDMGGEALQAPNLTTGEECKYFDRPATVAQPGNAMSQLAVLTVVLQRYGWISLRDTEVIESPLFNHPKSAVLDSTESTTCLCCHYSS